MKYGIDRKICVFFLLAIASIGGTSAAVMSIDPVDKNVNINDQFSLNIQIDPEGATVAGAQTDIHFNPTYLQAVSVVEGTFLNRGGQTFFRSGTIDNTNGIISGIGVSALYIGGQNSKGTFVTINFRATDNQGRSDIEIINPGIFDPDAKTIGSTKQNGAVVVGQPPPPVPELSTTILTITGLIGLFGLVMLRNRN